MLVKMTFDLLFKQKKVFQKKLKVRDDGGAVHFPSLSPPSPRLFDVVVVAMADYVQI
jgi:hypothetical protein